MGHAIRSVFDSTHVARSNFAGAVSRLSVCSWYVVDDWEVQAFLAQCFGLTVFCRRRVDVAQYSGSELFRPLPRFHAGTMGPLEVRFDTQDTTFAKFD